MENDPDEAFPGKGNPRPDEELARLRRENAKLKKNATFKKSSRHLLADAPAVSKYQFVQAHASEYSVATVREGARGQPKRVLRLAEPTRKRAREEQPTPFEDDTSRSP
jgi:hypothetical protein